LQILLSFLDLLGVAFIGIITFLAADSESGNKQNKFLTSMLKQFSLENSDIATQIRILGFLAVAFLVCRTLLSIVVTRRSFRFLAIHSAQLSGKLAHGVLAQKGQEIRNFPSQQTSYALTIGVERAIIGTLGTSITIVADMSVAIVLSLGLLFVNFYIAVFTLLYFGLVGVFLHLATGKKARIDAVKLSSFNISGGEMIVEAITNYRDLAVRNRLKHYSSKFQENRRQATTLNAQMAFVPYIGKYVLEASIIVGAMGLGTFLSFSQDGASAVSTLAIFLAASTRIAPAILRLQQGVLQLAYSSGFSDEAVKLAESIKPIKSTSEESSGVDLVTSFKPTIEVSDLEFNFKYNVNCI
jgi:ATP-binding cassette subfamily C protein